MKLSQSYRPLSLGWPVKCYPIGKRTSHPPAMQLPVSKLLSHTELSQPVVRSDEGCGSSHKLHVTISI